MVVKIVNKYSFHDILINTESEVTCDTNRDNGSNKWNVHGTVLRYDI